VVSLTQGTPNVSGHVFCSPIPAAPTVLGSGCIVELDLATFMPFIPVTTDASGAWNLIVPVPPNPSMVGEHLALQIALLGTAGPLGFDISNGLIVTVGY
jgi:hypothetical protein